MILCLELTGTFLAMNYLGCLVTSSSSHVPNHLVKTKHSSWASLAHFFPGFYSTLLIFGRIFCEYVLLERPLLICQSLYASLFIFLPFCAVLPVVFVFLHKLSQIFFMDSFLLLVVHFCIFGVIFVAVEVLSNFLLTLCKFILVLSTLSMYYFF